MKSCRTALWILLLLTTTTGAPSVKVKLHDSAVLPCSERCSGVVRWSVHHKPRDTLAECDQTSCRSVKEGYQMIHDQYLKGDLSLTITGADFSKRGWYTCNCDGTDLCEVRLLIEALKTPVQMKPTETLVLKLDVSDPVEMVYNGSSDRICTVEGGSLQCRSEYSQRTSLSSALELRGMKESDSGVYTVWDSSNEEVLHIYTVTVRDAEPDLVRGEGAGVVPVWVLVVLLVAALVVVGVSVWFNVQQRRELQQLQKEISEIKGSEESYHSPEDERLSDLQ